MSIVVQQDEYLARYLTSEGWFSGNIVKGEAFRPQLDHKALKTSVTQHDGNNPSEVERRGRAWQKMPKRKKPVNFLGWGDVKIPAVLEIPTLDIEPAPSALDPNHKHIIGWALDEGKNMLQAEDVARQAKLYLVPNPS